MKYSDEHVKWIGRYQGIMRVFSKKTAKIYRGSDNWQEGAQYLYEVAGRFNDMLTKTFTDSRGMPFMTQFEMAAFLGVVMGDQIFATLRVMKREGKDPGPELIEECVNIIGGGVRAQLEAQRAADQQTLDAPPPIGKA